MFRSQKSSAHKLLAVEIRRHRLSLHFQHPGESSLRLEWTLCYKGAGDEHH